MIRHLFESLRLRYRLALKWQADIQYDSAVRRVDEAYTELSAALTDLTRREKTIELADLCSEARWNVAKVLQKLGVPSFEKLTPEQYAEFKKAALEKIADKVIP